MSQKPKNIILVCGTLILIVVCCATVFFTGVLSSLFPWFSLKNYTNTTTSETLVDCSFTANAPVTKNPLYTTTFYTARLDEKQSYLDTTDTGLRTFSLKTLKDKANLKQDFVLRFEPASGGTIPKPGVEISYQFCNSDNKTNRLTFAEPSDNNVSAISTYLHQGRTPSKAGIYRADAVLRVNGTVYLIDRESNITITE